MEESINIRPPGPATETIATINLVESHISISFPEKNDDFKAIIKAHGYRWCDGWKKYLSFRTGKADDRLAEIGYKLLSEGFCIRIDPSIKEKIINQDFSQEQTRWISVLDSKPSYFYIQWKYSDNMYNEAKMITGARYDKPGIIVPMEHSDEILDFADMYEFKFSPAALKLVDKAKEYKESAIVVELKKIEKKELPKNNGIPVLDVPKNETAKDEFKD